MKISRQYSILCAVFILNFVRPGSGHAEIFNYLDRVSGVTVMTNVPPPLGSDSDGDHTPQVRNRSSRINEKNRPVGFPTVNPQLQKERDSEKREILQNELEGEQQHINLALARKEPANVIHRHLENITALKRELSHLRSN